MAVPTCIQRLLEDIPTMDSKALSVPSGSRYLDTIPKEINLKLVVSVPDQSGFLGHSQVVEIPALANDTILSIKLRLRNTEYLSDAQYLFFGDRQLLEHETIGQLVESIPGHSEYLHIFACMSEVEAFSVKAIKQSFSMTKIPDATESVSPMKSALTASLLSSSHADVDVPVSSLVKAVPPAEMPDRTISSAHTIVHLMFKKTAKAEYNINNNVYEISISGSDTPEDVMRRIEAESDVCLSKDHDLMYQGHVLQKGKPLASYGIGKGDVLEIVPVEPINAATFPDGSPLLSSPDHKLYDNWQRARQGLACGVTPKLSPIGAGGSYFLQDCHGQCVAVFKPQDEEPKAVNNPKGLSTSPDGEGLRRGSRPGEGAIREVAAYLLDHEHFAGVPPTAMVTCSVSGSEHGVKVGSLQQFVPADSDCEERGTSFFPVSEVHKIAVLDIRLANTDRNGGNILVKETGGVWKLVPIDHGYCLPETFEDINFEWLYWPQAAKPFSTTELEYIERLDADKDIAILSAHNIFLRPESCRVLRVCTMLLKKAARLGLTAFQIGVFMSREDARQSELERLHARAMHMTSLREQLSALALTGGNMSSAVYFSSECEEEYLACMSGLLDDALAEISFSNFSDLDCPP